MKHLINLHADIYLFFSPLDREKERQFQEQFFRTESITDLPYWEAMFRHMHVAYHFTQGLFSLPGSLLQEYVHSEKTGERGPYIFHGNEVLLQLGIKNGKALMSL